MRRRKKGINQFQKWLVYSNSGRERKRIRDKDLSAFGKPPIISVSLTLRRHRYGRTYSEASDVDTDKNWRLRSNLPPSVRKFQPDCTGPFNSPRRYSETKLGHLKTALRKDFRFPL